MNNKKNVYWYRFWWVMAIVWLLVGGINLIIPTDASTGIKIVATVLIGIGSIFLLVLYVLAIVSTSNEK